MDYINFYSSPLGPITLASNGTELTGLWFDGQKYYGSTLSSESEERDLPVFQETKHWLDTYFAGDIPKEPPSLCLKGSSFRKSVWKILLSIPYGETVTYGEIATMISHSNGSAPVAAQAVGGAVGHNPVSIIVPCHRVVGANRQLTGYAGGIHRKKELLRLESIL